MCTTCGKRLQEQRASRDLWCDTCQRRTDVNIVAVMHQSLRGWEKFVHSKYVASESMVRERSNMLTTNPESRYNKVMLSINNMTEQLKFK